MDKKLIKENIKLTEDTITSLEKMRIESQKKGEEIERDCKAGLEVNKFVLEKLKEELKK